MGTEMMNVLLTCAGRRVALMAAFRRACEALGLAGRVLAADATSASAAFHEADEGLLVPRVDSDEYIPVLLDLVAEHDVKLLCPMTDLDLLALARHRDDFGAAGCTAMIACEETIALCRDKAATAKVLAAGGLASVHTVTLGRFREEPFYPCFAKPAFGSASVGAAAIRSERELEAHVARYGPDLVIQEWASGQEFTLDVYRSRDGVVRCVVPRQRLAVRSGEVEKAVTVRDEALIEAGVRAGVLLGDLWGVFCCQCRRASPRRPPKFFEVNPRFGGGAPLSIAAGADLARYLLEEVTGREISAEVGRFTPNLLMLRYDQAAFVQLDSADVTSLPGYTTPTFR